jgi:hypothetical protein
VDHTGVQQARSTATARDRGLAIQRARRHTVARTFTPIEFDTLYATGEKSNGQCRELAHRSNDGLDVTLLWHPVTNDLVVRAWDQHDNTRFEVHPNPENALEAYYHPYGYHDPADDASTF